MNNKPSLSISDFKSVHPEEVLKGSIKKTVILDKEGKVSFMIFDMVAFSPYKERNF